MTNHPITPPPELVRHWIECCDSETLEVMIEEAARWGADQELEACCEWLQDPDLNVDTYKLRAARRQKPPSLKDEALKALRSIERGLGRPEDTETIRRALEQLND